MPNLASIYSEATKAFEPIEEQTESIAEQELTAQQRYDWLKSPVTVNTFSSISNAIEAKMKQAIDLAMSYPQTKNHDKVIQLLVEINTLGNIIKTYGN